MIAFWIVAGLLAVAALLFVLMPLFRRTDKPGGASRNELNLSVHRDQIAELDADRRAGTLSEEQYAQARREVEAQVLEDAREADSAPASRALRGGRAAAMVAGVAIPVLAVLLYLALGNPGALSPESAGTAQQGGSPHGLTPKQIEAMVGQLADRLEKNPGDGEGWVTLARTNAALGRFQEASKAFAKAATVFPDDAALLADYADVLAMSQGRRLQGEPVKIILRALNVDPKNLKALALAGSAEFERKDYAGAVKYWKRLVEAAPPGSEFARSIEDSIKEAQQLAAQGGGATPPAQLSSRTREQPEPAPRAGGQVADAGKSVAARRGGAAGSGDGVGGTVRLAPALAGKVKPEDTVFIFARPVSGARMPLAVLRMQVKELPVKFRLDDTMAMAPNAKVSDYPQLVVSALVSKSSEARPKSGDLEGATPPVRNSDQGVVLVIDRVVP